MTVQFEFFWAVLLLGSIFFFFGYDESSSVFQKLAMSRNVSPLNLPASGVGIAKQPSNLRRSKSVSFRLPIQEPAPPALTLTAARALFPASRAASAVAASDSTSSTASQIGTLPFRSLSFIASNLCLMTDNKSDLTFLVVHKPPTAPEQADLQFAVAKTLFWILPEKHAAAKLDYLRREHVSQDYPWLEDGAYRMI